MIWYIGLTACVFGSDVSVRLSYTCDVCYEYGSVLVDCVGLVDDTSYPYTTTSMNRYDECNET